MKKMSKIAKPTQEKACRHILSLSGGKDSTALALYMRDKIPSLEYVFCDTEKELTETYEYLEKLEVYLGKKILRIVPDIGFDDLLEQRGGFLPSPQIRWCTELLKLKPFEKFIGDEPVFMYIGIRADEPHRTGYVSSKPNIQPKFPFVEDGLKLADIVKILEDSNVGLPEYYKWRSRSGCFFCYYQQRREWIGLLETHPKLYKQAMAYEKEDPKTGERYTWIQGESLVDLAKPSRIKQIKADYAKKRANANPATNKESPLITVFDETEDSADKCVICHL